MFMVVWFLWIFGSCIWLMWWFMWRIWSSCRFICGWLVIRRGRRILRLNHMVGALVAADLVVWRVDVASAALGVVGSVRLTVHHSLTAHSRSGIVHRRLAATRGRPKRAVHQPPFTTDLLILIIRLASAARVIVAVDDRIAAAL